MIGHYFTAALAGMRGAPVTTAAKILTLALGLLAMLCVCGVVSYWRSSDSRITTPGRTIVFTTQTSGEKVSLAPNTGSAPILAKYLRQEVPELEKVARYRTRGDVAVDTGERTLVLKGANAEPDFLDIFHFDFVAGDAKTALRQEDAVILTSEAARRLFGAEPVLGRRLVMGGNRALVVTGVIGPIPRPSQFADGDARFDYLSVMPPLRVEPDRWLRMEGPTFALLPADQSLSFDELDRRLAAIIERHVNAEEKAAAKLTLGAIGVDKLTELDLNADIFGPSGAGVSVVAVFYGLGLLVLGVACLNYANLATAQAVAHARQIGMHRVLGAGRMGILMQSWVDAGVSTLAALVLAGLFLWLAGPVIAAQTGIDIFGALARDPRALALVGAVAVALTLAAGIYPAFVVSRVRPVEALRAGKVRAGSSLAARVLVGVQFASASALLIAVIVVHQQNAHTRTLALDRKTDPVVILPTQTLSGVSVDTLRQQLAGAPQIKAVGEAERAPWGEGEMMTSMSRDPNAPMGPDSDADLVVRLGVGYGYFDVYGQKLLAGRAFEQGRDAPPPAAAPTSPGVAPAPKPPAALVIDNTYARKLGFASPQAAVGQMLYSRGRSALIIGVVEDRPYAIQSSGAGGTMFALQPNRPDSRPFVRIAADDVDGGVAALKRVWRGLARPGTPDFRFEDEIFDENFSAFERIGRLFVALSLLAFAISSIGLFGMAVHTTQRRRHEIGVRKTLGSTAGEVVRLLLADFSKPVIVANLIAWPLGYLAAQLYLSSFANRIDLSPVPFVLSLIVTLAIAWLAVGGQTLKAARVRPAQVLRDA